MPIPPRCSVYADHLRPGRLAIFLFHGVIPRHRHVVRNYTRKHIDRARFRAVLRALIGAGGRALSMGEVLAHLQEGAPFPPRAFAVTFDDGFENNVSVAAPCLAELGVPATFYVTTGFVGTSRVSWTDAMESVVEARPRFSLDWPAFGISGVFGTVRDKVALLEALRKRIKSDRAIDPYAAAADLRRRLEVTTCDPDPDLDRKIGWRQLRELSRHPLFTIGGHGHTHRILSFLTPRELDGEVGSSVRLLGVRVGGPVVHYSYPEGLAHCFNERVIKILRRAGVACCPTAMTGINPITSDPFRLRRIPVI